jgi:hypothetical protein
MLLLDTAWAAMYVRANSRPSVDARAGEAVENISVGINRDISRIPDHPRLEDEATFTPTHEGIMSFS